MKRIAPLIGLILLAGCHSEDERWLLRLEQEADHTLCIKRGGDYDKCRAALAEKRDQNRPLPKSN
ncbi:MAG: hypothetical protein WDO17_19010 [Alphaproteobacteria bacterium]